MKKTTEKPAEKPPPFRPKFIKKSVPKSSTTYSLSNGTFLTLENKNFNDLQKQLNLFE